MRLRTTFADDVDRNFSAAVVFGAEAIGYGFDGTDYFDAFYSWDAGFHHDFGVADDAAAWEYVWD